MKHTSKMTKKEVFRVLNNSRAAKKQDFAGLILTALIIVVLLFSGSAEAITIGFTDRSDTTPNEQTDVTFRIYADMISAERIPVTNLTLYVGSSSCTFYTNGTEISGTLCNSVTITKNRNVPAGYGYGFLSGNGTNTSNEYEYVEFGYGYGFTNNASAWGYELDYNVTWTTPDVAANTEYSVKLDVNAKQGSTSHTYSKTQSSFFTVQYVRTSSGGGGIKTTVPTQLVKLSSVPRGSKGIFGFTDTKLGIQQIMINALNDISNARINVYETVKPFGASLAISTADGLVYKYLSIEPSGFTIADVSEVTFNFQIPKSWFEANGLNPASVVLKRYVDGKWEELSTSMGTEKTAFYEFEATSPWFSVFAMTAKKGAYTPTGSVVETPAVEEEITPEPAAKQPAAQTVTTPSTPAKKSGSSLFMLIVMIGIVIGLIVFMTVKYMPAKKKEHPLDQYIRHVKAKGHKRHIVRSKLLKHGWDEIIVEHHLNKHYQEIK
ncbi:MAG: PGF-pre-PGF domain-containing protein [Candidatus Woesearchaeota archaeon]